jgi:glycine/D-amino acid oxidase-like deaminating enzyme
MASGMEQQPLGNYTTTDASVILGAGIIGLTTAYHLSEMIGGPIYVIDPASKVCAGASGQCEGAIGDFGVFNDLSILNELSFKMYQQIAQKYSGKERFGFSGMDMHAPFSDGFNPSDPRLPWPVQEREDLSKLPHWLRVSKKWEAGLIARQPHAMRLWVSSSNPGC